MKFQRRVFVALMLFMATPTRAMTRSLPHHTIIGNGNSTIQHGSERPCAGVENTACDLASSVHFSNIPSEFLAAIASYLSPEHMTELARAGRMPNYIVALAASRIESFRLKKDKPVQDQLKFLLKASGDKNTFLKTLDAGHVKLSMRDISLIRNFSGLENFKVSYQMNVIDTLKMFLTNADVIEEPANETLKSLDVPEQLDEADQRWITDRFPNAKIITPVTKLEEGDNAYDTLPLEFQAMGPGNIYQIRDPKNQIEPFVLSDFSKQKMKHYDAPKFCASKGGRLPSKAEFEALGRAMTRNRTYNPNLIPGIEGKLLWSSTVVPYFSVYLNVLAFTFFGSVGSVVWEGRGVPICYVLCVR